MKRTIISILGMSVIALGAALGIPGAHSEAAAPERITFEQQSARAQFYGFLPPEIGGFGGYPVALDVRVETRRIRTETSGLKTIFRISGMSWFHWRKLKRRTLYGQLLAQYRVPTQRLYAMSFRPSGEWTVAATGQTLSHGAFSHCWQAMGCMTA